MENFDDFENKSYKEGVKVKYGFSDYFKHFSRMFIFTLQIAFVMAQEIFQKLIFGTKEKNIHGQLALVTGKYFAIPFFTRQRLNKNLIIILEFKKSIRWCKWFRPRDVISLSTRRL